MSSESRGRHNDQKDQLSRDELPTFVHEPKASLKRQELYTEDRPITPMRSTTFYEAHHSELAFKEGKNCSC
ncbi:unnamed protein product [Protopolystoma xenopodis]|uniref:Uncharacterized protein n=1 Tax=Protopolystoma xenopodis TaxID=117903 RepID=A0A3S5A9H6_9PLAT|nr:unnamed protein product [Protopolystoma xenopodis]